MAIGLVAAAGASATSVSSIACPVPAGTGLNHFMLWVVSQNTPTNPTGGDPAGWTRLQWGTTTAVGSWVWYKFGTGSEPASYTSPTLSAAQTSTTMVSFSGVDLTTPLDVAVPVAVAGTTAFAFPSVTPVTTGAWPIGIGTVQYAASATVGTISSSNTTIPTNGSNASSGAASVAHIVNAVGYMNTWASGAFTPAMTQSATAARTLGQTFALRPAAAAARTPVRRISSWR